MNINKTQYLRLQEYLIDLHNSEVCCVFIDFSGHVDWLRIEIAESKDLYMRKLYSKTVYTDSLKKKKVDEIINEIEIVLLEKDKRIREAKNEEERVEYEKYLELKAKFGDEK